MTIAIPATPAPKPRKFGIDLLEAGAAGVRGGAVRADRAAAVVAGVLRLHRQERRLHRSAISHRLVVGRRPISIRCSPPSIARDLVGADLLRGGRADGLAGGAHRHAAAPHRAHPGDGLVRHAAVPRRHRLGAAGRAQQRAAQPALPRAHRRARRTRICSTSTASPGWSSSSACYTFPYVFVLVANALDRTPGDLEDASAILGGSTWDTARRITIPLALPAVLAGALVAFLQAMTLFGSPAILAMPAGFHTMTTKIWSLFQFRPSRSSPPPPRCRCWCSPSCCCAPSTWCSAGAAIRWSAARTASRASCGSAAGAG